MPLRNYLGLSLGHTPIDSLANDMMNGNVAFANRDALKVAAASSSASGSNSDSECDHTNSKRSSLSCPMSLKVLGSNLPEIPTVPTGMNGKSNEEKLLDLMVESGYQIMQRNGQRIFGGPPPNWTGLPPPKGSEIFVGKVPRDCFEWELVPIFGKIGQIYELRLMMDFSGSNRGYMFVRYTCRDDAKRAIRELNNFEIRPGKFIGVIPSVDNRKLWISGIPQNRSAEEIKTEMAKITDGVRSVHLCPNPTDMSKTRGYAFVEYETHRAAALARRKLVPGRIFLFDQEIEKVDWAEPENEVDDEVMAKVRVIFIRNVMPHTSEETLEDIFNYLSKGDVQRVKKKRDYAFIHFFTREGAERAVMAAEATGGFMEIEGAMCEIKWSKPVDRDIQRLRQNSQQTNRSVTCAAQGLPMQLPLKRKINNPIMPSNDVRRQPFFGNFYARDPADAYREARLAMEFEKMMAMQGQGGMPMLNNNMTQQLHQHYAMINAKGLANHNYPAGGGSATLMMGGGQQPRGYCGRGVDDILAQKFANEQQFHF